MDPAPFSPAKITMPRLQKVLHRQRLFRLLDKSRSYPGIWVSGPGGSGKTTLIASYIEQHHLPCLWYQIDERDADIATFFYYLGLAGKKLAPEKKDLPHLSPEYIPGIATFTRQFFEDLFERMEKPGVLVLDNYQDALPDCLLHEVLCHALQVIPEDVNLMISSRSEPPPVLARARAGDLLHEIGWPELRLHPHETNDLVRFLARTPPSEAFMNFLHKKIDGWIAGVLLLIKQAETEAIDLRSFSQSSVREVFDYFSSELFDKADSNTRAFLLSTAVLPNMSAGMAGRLTGAENAEQILFRLWQNHWFTERYPDGREIRYQYHPMFRDFLLSRAVQTYPNERIAALKKRAARLLEADGQIEPAVELLFESGEQRAVLKLILRQAQDMVIQGRKQTLAQWLQRLPGKYLRKHPLVLYWLGMCRHRMDPEEGRGYFEQAFTIFEAQKDTAGVCVSLCGLLDSITYGFNTFKPLDPWIAKLTPLSGEYEHLPTPEIKGLLTASAIFAMTFRQPDHPEFSIWENRGLDMIHGGAPEYIRLRVIMALCSHRIFSGDLAGAGSLLELYRELVQSPNVPPYARITLKHLETFYYLLTGSFDACRKTAAEALDLGATTGVHVLSPLILGHAAASALSSGNLADARKRLLPMTHYTNSADWIFLYFYILRIWEALLEGDTPKALANEELTAPYVARTGMMATAAIGHLGMALARHAGAKTAEAANLLDQALSICHRMGTRQVEFACYLAQAELALDAGDDTAGLHALDKAMAIGKARHYVHTWFWRPETITRLCCKALEADIEVAYVQDLIRRRNLTPASPPLEIPNWPWPVKIYTLGRFALVRDGKPLDFTNKNREKPVALLKTLIALGGRNVNENQVADILWPEANGDASHGALKTTLHRLRRVLGCREAVQKHSGSITIDARYCWVDAWVFERMLSKADMYWQSAASEKDRQKAAAFAHKALDLYKGRLFQSEDDKAIRLRDHLHHRFLQGLEKLASHLQHRERWEEAIALYEAGINLDELAEPFYRGLMTCNLELGRKAKALAAYSRCKRMLAEHLHLPPSAETESLKNSLLQQ